MKLECERSVDSIALGEEKHVWIIEMTQKKKKEMVHIYFKTRLRLYQAAYCNCLWPFVEIWDIHLNYLSSG